LSASHHIDNSGNFGQVKSLSELDLPSSIIHKTMLQAAVRAAVRPAAQATRSTLKSTSTISKNAIRTFSTTPTCLSGGAEPPKLFGPGAPAGQVPSDELQATGLARLELLAEMQGVSLFDEEPLDASRLGTLDDPVKVYSLVRIFLSYTLSLLQNF